MQPHTLHYYKLGSRRISTGITSLRINLAVICQPCSIKISTFAIYKISNQAANSPYFMYNMKCHLSFLLLYVNLGGVVYVVLEVSPLSITCRDVNDM